MHKLGTTIVLLAGFMVSPSANAQSWGVYIGNGPRNYQGPGYYQSDRRFGWNDGRINAVCSGQRAQMLEDRLRHEDDEGEIDDDDLDRIHGAIDRLEDKQDHECREGDWRGVRNISYQYDQIGAWIDREAHGRWRGDW